MQSMAMVRERAPLAQAVDDWLGRFGLTLRWHATDVVLPGSYWGGAEAGIIGRDVHVHADTPLHSLLHESAHLVCAHAAGRHGIEGDAGGADIEEAAVCYLQLAVADALPGVGRAALARDMDAWGYSFRAGSTAAWFGRDAEDARVWLCGHGLGAVAGLSS